MKLLYLTTWDFTNEQADGVCKKIRSQISVFENHGYEVDIILIRNGKVIYREGGKEREIAVVGSVKKTPAYFKMYKTLKNKKYDWIYNRYGMMDTFYYRGLKRLHQNGARVLIEIPTYPYKGEKPQGILYQLMFWWDEVYTKKLKRVTDRIITYSQDEEIFGVSTIEIMNGVDVEAIKPVQKEEKTDDTIDLLIVALMQPYHGYERLLKGLHSYYQKGGTRDIFCHFVGDGPEKHYYEELTEEYGLNSRIRFYGMQGGDDLDKIYNKVDIGICSLGCYKKGIYWSSELKSREYLSKGIPIVAGINIDILKVISKEFYLQFPNDDSEINLEEIIDFYDKIYKNDRRNVAKAIRDMARKYIDIETTMQPICVYIDKE